MANLVVKDNRLKFNGVAYFRAKAEEVRIGSYGLKRTPLLKSNFLEVKDSIPTEKLNIVNSTIVEVDTNVLSKTDINTDISAIENGKTVSLSADAAFEKLKQQHLKLVKFSTPINRIKDVVNNQPRVLEDLKRYGNDARIAFETFVVMEANLATKFTNNVSVKLSGEDGNLKATVGGSHSSSGETTIKISPQTTFAYLLLLPVWNKDKTKILDLSTDQFSVDV